MPYRETKDAIGRARDRLAVAKERLEEARADVERVAASLSDAMRALEIVRLEHGAATARVRQLRALATARPSDAGVAELADAEKRLAAQRAHIPTWEQTVADRRVALRTARRVMGAADRDRRQAELELLRLEGRS